ncbi:alpha/beta-hydrolase [Choiromyces venosus 120613-1]|uniref:Alpha/beta-hydrolase n=1 Tax=Choiromyces venosus 120613-1 TaxID=1336337 RepID=A0A3N4JV13_9PEZI|nr:alpha/beta-hydrolase [Choiromyces venosus 120613-1]
MATNNIKAIRPYDDPRVTHNFQVVNGKNYHYVHGMPAGSIKGTILCVHGFPDLWYGFRFIIPFLLEKGFRVIVPDMIGYGQTDAPRVPPADISAYSLKNHATDMIELLKILNVPKVILFGHDWGAAVTSRIYIYNNEIVSHIANVCVPFYPPIREYIPIRELVATKIPSFKYQIAFQDPQTEKDTEAPGKVRQFLNGLHRGRGDERGELMVDKDIVESIGNPKRSKFMTEEDLDYYAKEFERNGFHGPLNWYKAGKVNYEDEKDLPFEGVKVPYLFIGATHDRALPPSMAESQKHLITQLTTRLVDTGHWALVEGPEVVIGHMNEWFDAVVLGDKCKI